MLPQSLTAIQKKINLPTERGQQIGDVVNLSSFGGRYDRTTLNPSTIDVMVDSPSEKQKPARYKLPFSGNLFLVRVVIYDKIERI